MTFDMYDKFRIKREVEEKARYTFTGLHRGVYRGETRICVVTEVILEYSEFYDGCDLFEFELSGYLCDDNGNQYGPLRPVIITDREDLWSFLLELITQLSVHDKFWGEIFKELETRLIEARKITT